MTFSSSPQTHWKTPAMVLLCGTLILLCSFGIRQTYGLFLAPISEANGWNIAIFSVSMGLQVLIWGISQPIWGMIADKFGAGRVVSMGAVLYAVGLYMMAHSSTVLEIHFSTGFLTGIAMSATGFPIILAVIGRSVDTKRRSLYLGIASAGGSSGQVIIVPFAHHFMLDGGHVSALITLSALMILIIPLTLAVAGKPPRPEDQLGPDLSVREAILEALRHKGYVLLVIGFFVCGFQTLFIASHLPLYLKDVGISPNVAAWALASIGLFNIFGSIMWGALGGRFSKKYMLASLYMMRSAGIIIYMIVPTTALTTIIFASFMGLTWLGTIPLTSGLVAQIFGTQYMAMLYGFAFLSHQVGSFIGITLGGLVRDFSGSYDLIWWSAVGLGFVAALIHWPIDENPVDRIKVHLSAS
jgi:MFS family permease